MWKTRPSTCRKQLRPGISNGVSPLGKSEPIASDSARVRKLYVACDSSIVTPKSSLKSVPNDEYHGTFQPFTAFHRSSFANGARDTIA